MTGYLVTMTICLTAVTLVSLAGLVLLIWWTMSSSGRHSTSAGNSQRQAMEAMLQVSDQAAENLRLQMQLTELLLLGRPMQENEPMQQIESDPETTLTPEELWMQLPDPVKETMQREHEEGSTWREASEMLQEPFEEDPLSPLKDSLIQSLSPT